ncbi:LysR family transcriptional regulator [Bosea sp. WAO]|uniref:LysR family transcriptional regulator ArgP n=1 Tax=Bosea sp. WAO TaxID=406341 RepID=UPI00074AF340|nr:LysR family transcriptional regulator ArgP [Bosea sp. WAO]KUL95674.1 LysR family transcriptional regulator [Bosea sp. WAO]
MLDYPALQAVSLVVRTGSFERAAQALNVTPSAVSQRVKQLEERMGTVLIVRGQPCTATERGEWLCRHMEQVGLLERDLMERLPALAEDGAAVQRVTLRVATNADSLGTWFLRAVATFAEHSPHLLDIAVDDQEHTAEWLRRGRVLAAVTALAQPIQGCRVMPLGSLRYRATASPDFVARHFPEGVTLHALALAPSLVFNQKDRLQRQWMQLAFGASPDHPVHWVPSTQGFVDASLLGIGWCVNPELLVKDHIAAGRLRELELGRPLDIPLFWQVNRIASDRLADLTRAVVETARRVLINPQG